MTPANPHNALHSLSVPVAMICITMQYPVGTATSGITEPA